MARYPISHFLLHKFEKYTYIYICMYIFSFGFSVELNKHTFLVNENKLEVGELNFMHLVVFTRLYSTTAMNVGFCFFLVLVSLKVR